MAATDRTWQKYTNPVLGLSMDFPTDWGFEESASVGIVVFADAETLKSQSTSSGRALNLEMCN